MTKNISVGIDIGTQEIKVAICEAGGSHEKGFPRVLGLGLSESRGLRRGYIVNTSEVIKSLSHAVRQAEKNAGMKIKKAYIALGGIGLQSVVSTGSVIISRADNEVTDLDVEVAIQNSEKEIPKNISINHKVIHTIPIQYKIDGKAIWGRPHGMKGVKLEVKTLFITCLEQYVNDLIECVEEFKIEVEDIIASPIAASLVSVSKLQKIAGCVLVNIGAETVSMVVFENNIPISLEVLPIGSNDITNDIALGFKISLEEAENIKRDGRDNTTHSKKKIEEIVSARLTDVFELIDIHLKKIGRNGLLPAGVIFIGGGSLLTSISEFAKDTLKLPSKISEIQLNGNIKSPVRNVVWAVSYGLCLLGFTNADENSIGIQQGLKFARSTTRGIMSWVKQFLP